MRIRSRRRLLLLPFALLSAALFGFSRRPRPQTDSDAWLWEQADRATGFEMHLEKSGAEMLQLEGKFARTGSIWITDRQKIRALFHTLRGTPSFSRADYVIKGLAPVHLMLFKGKGMQAITLYRYRGHTYLGTLQGSTRLDDAYLKRFSLALQEVTTQAWLNKPGYELVVPLPTPTS